MIKALVHAWKRCCWGVQGVLGATGVGCGRAEGETCITSCVFDLSGLHNCMPRCPESYAAASHVRDTPQSLHSDCRHWDLPPNERPGRFASQSPPPAGDSGQLTRLEGSLDLRRVRICLQFSLGHVAITPLIAIPSSRSSHVNGLVYSTE